MWFVGPALPPQLSDVAEAHENDEDDESEDESSDEEQLETIICNSDSEDDDYQ